MKFYEIQTDEGPQFVSTQAEAKAAGVKNPQPVEVPSTEKEALRQYLNDLKREASISTVSPAPAPAPSSDWTDEDRQRVQKLLEQTEKPKPKQATKLFEQDDIVDLILESRGFQLANYFEAVMEAAERVRRATLSS